MSGTVLRTQDLSARFGGVVALDGITIAIDDGALVSVIGPNGAGKSTLLNGISRLIRTQGKVAVFDKDITATPPYHLATLGLARTFQDPQLIDSDTVLENVLAGAHSTLGYGFVDQAFLAWRALAREREAVARAMDLLALAGLADVAERRCSELAYGPRKMIDILRALMGHGKLVLLDEPSSGLDRLERKKVEQLLTTVNRTSGTTMLVVEHHMDLVRAISSRVIALQTGRVLMDGSAESVLQSQEFRVAMVGAAAA